MVHKAHPYHIVQLSPWPFVGATAGLTMAIGVVQWFHIYNVEMLVLGVPLMLVTIYLWWRDVVREGLLGNHTHSIQVGLRYGILLFITSEVIFFFAFFWAFFHSRLSPTGELGIIWPPAGITGLNPIGVPLLNTAVLLASGATVTWAHHGLLNNYRCELGWGLAVTVYLGVYFTILQKAEYGNVGFAIGDSVFGSTFFVATGFHGLHVIIGTTFLFIIWLRTLINHFSSSHHKGIEFAAWYWHFVDVVWIFLYIFIYWWSVFSNSIKVHMTVNHKMV